MLMVNPGNNPREKELLRLFRGLSETGKANLLAFAAFLHERANAHAALTEKPSPAEPPVPKEIPRPEFETVIGAIKRLSETYYMLDRSQMLEDTSNLMTGHLLQGRDAMEVIDELEQLFQRHFQNYQGS